MFFFAFCIKYMSLSLYENTLNDNFAEWKWQIRKDMA